MSTEQEATPIGYATPVEQWNGWETPCCKRDVTAVYYNPYNRVMQCHNCGHVWEPKSLTADSFTTMRDALRTIAAYTRIDVTGKKDDCLGRIRWAYDIASSALAALDEKDS